MNQRSVENQDGKIKIAKLRSLSAEERKVSVIRDAVDGFCSCRQSGDSEHSADKGENERRNRDRASVSAFWLRALQRRRRADSS